MSHQSYSLTLNLQSGSDLWLVFQDEGKSLHSLMYSTRTQQENQNSSATPPGSPANTDTLTQQGALMEPTPSLQADAKGAGDEDAPQVPLLSVCRPELLPKQHL